MAKATLPVNFKDDILNAGMDGKRKFTITQNTDGTYSIEDVTEYDQIGSNFGSAQINATNTAVNASADASKIIDDLATVAANTQKGYMAGALALKKVNQSLKSKSDTSHTHDDRYYTKSEINGKITTKTLTIKGLGYNFVYAPNTYGYLINASIVSNSTTPYVLSINKQSSGIYSLILDETIPTSTSLNVVCTWINF